MKTQLDKLNKERDQLMERVKKIDNAIKAFREVCEHKNEDGSDAMEYIGHDSHQNHYVCKICGKKNYS